MVQCRLLPATFIVVAVAAVASAGTSCYRAAAFPDFDDLRSWDCTPGTAPKQSISNKMSGLQFNVTCDDPIRCEEVQTALMQVKSAVESAIQLSEPVLIDLQYKSFCTLLQQAEGCATELAIARPANWIPLLDDDGDQRLYPQALVKQLGYPADAIPAYTYTDIVAAVNTDINWALPQVANSTVDQEDIVYVITHEIIHGLGFYSSWRLQMGLGGLITPFIESNNGGDLQVITGWKEFAFDRYLLETATRTSLSSYTARYRNNAILQLIVGQTLADASANLANSPYAKETSNLVGMAATTAGALALAPYPVTAMTQPIMMLESGLGSFISGETIVHASVRDYANGADALMIHTTRPGSIAAANSTASIPASGDNSTFATAPAGNSPTSSVSNGSSAQQASVRERVNLPHDKLLGPTLVRALSLLGYKTSAKPNGGYVPNLAPSISPKRPRSGASGTRSAGIHGVGVVVAASGYLLMR